MNVTLEISMKDILIALSDDSQDPIFNQALSLASSKEKQSQLDYLLLFEESFEEINTDGLSRLSSPRIFGNIDFFLKLI